MSELKGLWKLVPVALFAAIVVPLALALPDTGEVERAALRHVMSTGNYVENGGFGERLLNVSLDEDVCLVVVAYQTRSVGMLQMIGSFTSYVKIDSATLEILGSETAATCQVDQGDQVIGDGNDGNGSTGSGSVDPGWVPVINSTDPLESLMERAVYTINKTLGLIWTTSVKANFTEALKLIDWALETVEAGDYDTALDIASKAYELVVSLIYDDDDPVPEDPYILPAPEVWGFIVIFDHEPTPEDWERLEKEFGARYGGDAQEYLGEKNAYFVETNTTTPEELRHVEGIQDAREVVFFDTEDDSATPGGKDNHPATPSGEVPEGPFVLLPVLALAAAASRGRSLRR